MELSNALQDALAEQAQTLDVAALEQAFQQAGILPGDSWAGYERAKALAREATWDSAALYQQAIRFVVDYLGI